MTLLPDGPETNLINQAEVAYQLAADVTLGLDDIMVKEPMTPENTYFYETYIRTIESHLIIMRHELSLNKAKDQALVDAENRQRA